MSKTKAKTLYLVQEVLWEVQLDQLWDPIWMFDDQPEWAPDFEVFRCPNPEQGRPVKLFANKRSAEQFRTECEAKARQVRNPFRLGEDLEDLTSMPPGVFHDWLADAGIASPLVKPFDQAGWFYWWQSEDLTDEQRARIWQVLDKVQFFTVVPVEGLER
jgi:hypothetical protein